MEIQLTLDDKDMQEAIRFWLENVKGVVGVKSMVINSNYGSNANAVIKINEVDFAAGVKKQAKKEMAGEAGGKVTVGRPLDMS